ncbi:MAG: efflux RND transporter periplasmic adaptor subunit [Candidatus Methylacidiphilales bacterium]
MLTWAGSYIVESFGSVSTDDAYVNSYATFVAPRVTGQVKRVFVQDNYRVKKGDVLLELDPEPYQVRVAVRKAAVDKAKSDLVAADASVHAMVAKVRSDRFALDHAIEDVHRQISLLRQRVATWEKSKASLNLARMEYDRAVTLYTTKVVSKEELDRKREALDVTTGSVSEAMENILQVRVALGLPPQVAEGQSLADVPADLDQTYSAVREALSTLLRSAADLGINFTSFKLTPKEAIAEFYHRDPQGDLDRIYTEIIANAPPVRQAQAALEQAQRDLEQAKLDLRYCTIVSEIDGVVTRRNVNPGNYVQTGQNLMVVRSLREVWVDANFKETQLAELRIGQKVKLRTDMYGTRHVFEGRISGFTMGTGSTLALLPAQNATGNFVKVVQRLPVRIELVDYNPDKLPLFVGLSIEPVVDLRTKPEGPNAGQYLQESYVAKEGPAAPVASAN